MTLDRRARRVSAARTYCLLERPYVAASAERPASSRAANLDGLGSSTKADRMDNSERNVSVAGEGDKEKRSRKRGGTSTVGGDGEPYVVKMEVKVREALWRYVEMTDERETRFGSS